MAGGRKDQRVFPSEASINSLRRRHEFERKREWSVFAVQEWRRPLEHQCVCLVQDSHRTTKRHSSKTRISAFS